jgi:hypothetical protein
MSTFAWQTVGNVIGLITGIIAAGLYGNIGISAYSLLPYLSFNVHHFTSSPFSFSLEAFSFWRGNEGALTLA